MIKLEFIFWCVIIFAEALARKFQLNKNRSTTVRPDWQLFDDKTLSIVAISLIPALAILLLIVCCVLLCCCFCRKSARNLELTPEQLVKINAKPEELKAAGITPKTLKEYGASYKQMAKLGATPSQLVECGANKRDLEDLGATQSMISRAGVSDRKQRKKDTASRQYSSPNRTSSHNERINEMAKYFTTDNTSQHKLVSEKPTETEQSTHSQEDDTKSTVTTATTATALRPVKSDTFSTAMLAQGSEISTAPPRKQ